MPLANMTINMDGVTLVMGQRSSNAVLVKGWTNVTLKGLTIRYNDYPTNQAVITRFANNGTTIDVEVPTGYPLEDWQQGKTFSCNVYQGSSRYLRVGAGDMYAKRIAPLNSGTRNFRMSFGRDVSSDTQKIIVGDTLGCRNAAFAFTFHVDGCTASTFANITLKGGPGFGFFHGHPQSAVGTPDPAAQGGNMFSFIVVTYPDPPTGSNALPVLSASADAFHISGLRKGPHIVNSLLEGHNDDGIAIHGAYSVVVDRQRDRIWVTSADYTIGDTLRLYNTAFRLVGEVRVSAVAEAQPRGHYAPPHQHSSSMPNKHLLPEPQQWYQVLTLSGPLPDSLGFDWVVFSAGHASSGFELRGNVIRNHRARGMLIKASHGVVTDNHIANSSLGGIIITPELHWGEGDYVHNVTVSHNSVSGVCIGKQCYGGLALGAVNSSRKFAAGAPHGHKDVTIVGNTFRNISQMNLWVSSADRVRVEANYVYTPYAYAPVAVCCPPYPFPMPGSNSYVAWATESSDIEVIGNCVVQEKGFPGEVLFQSTPTVINGSAPDGGFRPC